MGHSPFLPCQTCSEVESEVWTAAAAAAASKEWSTAELAVSSDFQKHAVCPSTSESLSGHSFDMFEIDGYEKRQRKNTCFSHGTRRSDSSMHENIGIGVQKNGSRCSGLMTENLKYLAVAEGSLFAEGLESGTIMSVCRQQ